MNIEKILKNKGIVRNKKQANIVMIAIIIVCFIIIVMVSVKGSSSSSHFDDSPLNLEELRLMELADENNNNVELDSLLEEKNR